MRRPTLLFVPIVAMTLTLLFAQPMAVSAQSSSEGVQKETAEAWQAFKAYMIDQKNEAVAFGKNVMDKADTKIEELKGDAAKASEDTKTQYRKEIKNLKEKQANASKKLDELKKASADGWEATKEGFAKAYEDLSDAYHETVKKFK